MKNIIANGAVGLRHNYQDFYQITENDEVQVLVVCDGCSSAEYGQLAATLACLHATSYAKDFPALQAVFFDDNTKNVFVNGLLSSIREHIENSCKNLGMGPETCLEFASTFLFVLFFEGRYIAIQLGDGAIIISKNRGNMEILPTKLPLSQRNVTYSTCDLFLRSFDEILTVTAGYADTVFLMTDGMKPIFYDKENLHAMVMANHFYSSQVCLDMAERLVEVCASISLDDATFACVSNKTSPYDLTATDRSRLFGEEQTCKSRCSKFRKRNLRRSIRLYQLLDKERRQDELVAKLKLPPSLVSRICNKLENLGLIEKCGDFYRRTNRS